MRRAGVITALSLGWWMATSLPVVAHPLGNFTTNQYVGIHLEAGKVVIDYVLDLAEIPTSPARRAMDTNGDGEIDSSEEAAFVARQCGEAAEGLVVAAAGLRIELSVIGAHLSFPPGEAGLPTLRLECRLEAPIEADAPFELEVRNGLMAERLGWREMVLTAADMSVVTELTSSSVTQRLSAYPEDLLISPLDTRVGTAVVTPAPGHSIGSPPPPLGVVPAGDRSTPVDALASLLDRQAGSPAPGVAMMVALALGVVHALAPGHGKTVMAAYLVGSRGTVRQAALLGTVVAFAHTAGVLVLGLLTLVGTATFPSEKLYPVLSGVSGLIVVGIGAWMFLRWAGGHHHHGDHHHHHGAHHHGAHHHGVHHHLLLDSTEPGRRPALGGWRLLASMGLAGGLVPSASAVVLLLAAVNMGRVPLGLVLVLLFGVGMALTLVGVGLGMVGVSRLGMRRLTGGGLARWEALVTPVAAVVVMTVGALLTMRSM